MQHSWLHTSNSAPRLGRHKVSGRVTAVSSSETLSATFPPQSRRVRHDCRSTLLRGCTRINNRMGKLLFSVDVMCAADFQGWECRLGRNWRPRVRCASVDRFRRGTKCILHGLVVVLQNAWRYRRCAESFSVFYIRCADKCNAVQCKYRYLLGRFSASLDSGARMASQPAMWICSVVVGK